MNTLKFSLATGALSLMASSAVALDCTAAANSSSDYCLSVASQESWTEDSSNDFIRMANSFACVIANSAPGSNANRSYLALISEEACGLNMPDPDSKSTATVYTPGYMVSSWAGEGLTQEIESYFDSKMSGSQYVVNVNLRKTKEQLEPFGSWYFSFYSAGEVVNEDADEWVYEYNTAADAADYGIVDIVEEGNDVTITSFDIFDESEDCGDDSSSAIASKTKYVDGSADNTMFIGKVREKCVDDGIDETTITAGQTTEKLFFKLTVDSEGAAKGEQCLDRESQWSNAHDLALYDATSGERVELSGAFGFKLTDGTRGYMGNWGAWFDTTAPQFSPAASSIAITAETGEASSLIWAPGSLRSQKSEMATLANGDIFNTWINEKQNNYYIQWNAENETFVYDDDETAKPYMPTGEIWMWSSAKRASVVYTPADVGEDTSTTIKVMVENDLTFESTYSDEKSTKFEGRWRGYHGDLGSLPYTYADWSEANKHYDGSNTRSTYHYTGKEPDEGFEPYTLYLDDGDDLLSAADKPVRFDFAVSENGSKYHDFDTDELKPYSEDEKDWPAASLSLVLASEDGVKDNCDTSQNEVSGCTRHLWNFGAFPWDNNTAALTADGSFMTIEEPIGLTMTFDATEDRNNDQTMTFSTKDLSNTSLPGCEREDGKDYSTCEDIDVSVMNGEKIFLEFDGSQVHGRPGVHVCAEANCSSGSGFWTFAVNPKDGTTVTDSEGKKYLLAARGVSKAYAPAAAGACDTAGISFDAIADDNFKLLITNIPAVSNESTDYPLPSQSWRDKPADSALECTVTMGDATNCDALDES